MKSLLFGSAVTLLALCLAAGCNSEPSPQPVKVGPPPADDHSDHSGHSHEGPHHGHVIELGNEEYHAELTHDDATDLVAIYILDGEAKRAVPIEAKEVVINLVIDGQPQQFTLPAAPLEDEPEGQSSRFQLISQQLCDGWDAPKSTGRLNVTIAGKPYVGQFKGDHGPGAPSHDHP
jgi:hypothetical protein